MLAPLVLASTALALALGAGPAPSDPAAALASEIERGISRGEDTLTPNLDFDALMARTLRGLDLPPDFRKGILAGAAKAKQSIIAPLVAAMRTGGSFKLLRMHDAEGQRRALYRAILPNSSVSYLDVVLTPPGRTPVRAMDVYVASSGEFISESLRSFVMIAVGEAKLGILDRLMGNERVLIQNLPQVKQLAKQIQERQFEEAMATFESLPPELRRERVFLRLKFVAAQNLNEELYLAVIEEFQRAYPDGGDAALMAIDGHFLRKRYPEALAAIDRLERSVGGDPYIHVLRAGTYLAWGKRPEAMAAYRRTVAEEPTMAAPYWALIQMALEDADYGATGRWLDAIEKDAGVALLAPAELPEAFKGFIASREGKAWAKRRPAR